MKELTTATAFIGLAMVILGFMSRGLYGDKK
jgi:hypothetical protein